MYLALKQLRALQRAKPKSSIRSRRLWKKQQLPLEERRRYLWQAVWIAIILLAGCAFGGLLGYYYTD